MDNLRQDVRLLFTRQRRCWPCLAHFSTNTRGTRNRLLLRTQFDRPDGAGLARAEFQLRALRFAACTHPAARSLGPHTLDTYAYDLARTF